MRNLGYLTLMALVTGLNETPPTACGFGPSLALLMPGLMWGHRRRLRRAD